LCRHRKELRRRRRLPLESLEVTKTKGKGKTVGGFSAKRKKSLKMKILKCQTPLTGGGKVRGKCKLLVWIRLPTRQSSWTGGGGGEEN